MCQFKDPEPYFAAFHAHHERLMDKIIYIDHGSHLEFSRLSLTNTVFVACDISNFVKDIAYSKIINQSELLAHLDFLFILDIDEFLPFETQATFHKFLKSYANYGTGTLNWINGYPDKLKNLNSCPSLWVQEIPSQTKKLFYNLNKLKSFLPKEGNHNADYPFLGQTFVQIRPKRNKTVAPLIHLPIISDVQMSQKLDNFPKQDFRDKLPLVTMSEEFPKSPKEVAKLVSDYREQSPRNHKFIELYILKGLKHRMRSLTNSISELPKNTFTPQSLYDYEIKQLRTKGPIRLNNLNKFISLQDLEGCRRMVRGKI